MFYTPRQVNLPLWSHHWSFPGSGLEEAGGEVEHQPGDEGGEDDAEQGGPDAVGFAVVDALVVHLFMPCGGQILSLAWGLDASSAVVPCQLA